MSKRGVILTFCLAMVGAVCASAQIPDVCPYSPQHRSGLACLIPDATAAGKQAGLGNFNTTVAQVIGQLPLAVPVSGFVLGFDKKLGIPIEENQNLGSVITERGDTIGKYKLFLGFTFQRFTFQSIDGTKLNNLPLVFQTSGQIGYSVNNLSANVNQYTAIAAFGVTDRVDVSVILPFDRVSLSGGHATGTVNVIGSVCTPTNCGASFAGVAAGGSASGVGDMLLSIKGTVIKAEKSRVAVGLEGRLPTGDAYNLLGSGAYGVKPYVVFSRHAGRFTPHVNVGYQWNGFSVLRINNCYFAQTCLNGSGLPTLRLPDDIEYSAGADIGIVKKVSFVADLVGQRFFNAPRVLKATPLSAPNSTYLPSNATSIGVDNSSYNLDNLGIGLKVNPAGHLIISANALIRLDNNGLRPARFVPLVGLSYRF